MPFVDDVLGDFLVRRAVIGAVLGYMIAGSTGLLPGLGFVVGGTRLVQLAGESR